MRVFPRHTQFTKPKSRRIQLRRSRIFLSQTPPIASYQHTFVSDAVSSTVSPLLPLHTSPIHTRSSSAHHDSSNNVIRDNLKSLDQAGTENKPETQIFYKHIFSIDLPEGKCVGLQLPLEPLSPPNPASLDPDIIQQNDNHWIRQALHPDEVQFGMDLPSDISRNTFFIGRLAMRTALNLASKSDAKSYEPCPTMMFDPQYDEFGAISIMRDQHGRPKVPTGFLGSISHKKNTGVALVSSTEIVEDDNLCPLPRRGIGVDIEQTFSKRRSIAKKILTPNELNDLGNLEGVTKDEEVLLRFSLKESVYKAMHPLINQRVGFQEAEITPHSDGTASITLNLKTGAHINFEKVKAHWLRLENKYFLTSSSVELKDEK